MLNMDPGKENTQKLFKNFKIVKELLQRPHESF